MSPETSVHLDAACMRYKNSFNVINSYNTYVDEKPQVLEWLSPLEPRMRHQDVRTSRVDGLGEWLLQSDEFINWRDGKGESDRSPLFCSGAPGIGKTYLSSLVIDTLCDQGIGQKVGVACFYYDFQYQKAQTPENILGALIKQLVRRLGAIPAEIDDAFQEAKGQVGGRGLRVSELLPLLQAALAPLERAFICIDALDECLEKHLPELLRLLYTISQWSPKIRLFITGRPHIDREIEKHFPGGAYFVQIKTAMQDILKYLQMMLDNDPEPEAMNADLKAEVVKRISETISDVFLLVSLSITAILAEATIHGRREQLKRMTNGPGLGNGYRVALDRMQAQGGAKARLGMSALMWISQSERPMTVDELCHALGVEIGSTDLNSESIPSIQTLLASCLGLITVDKVELTVRLVHFTLQEYLDSHSDIFWRPYATMAEVCLTYLNYDYVNELSPALDSAPLTTPLLQYASTYWGLYARNETTESAKWLALRLLINFDSHISAKLLLHPHVARLSFEPTSQPEGFTGLHCVAYLGLDEVASSLLQMEEMDINRVDFLGCTPLMWAAKNGREGVIKLFLKQRDVHFGAADNEWGRTALSWAAEGGFEGIINLLLYQEDVDAESRDHDGRTPLSYAAEYGKEGAVRLFLDWGEVNAESRDDDGRTPLTYAAESGRVGAVGMLLAREEVSAESRDNDGRTPLSHAAQGGNKRALRLFLDREEVNSELRDGGGRTPLSWAAEGGYERVVKLLLGQEEVDAESRDNNGRTPLSYAAELGRVETVRLFLQRGDVNAESRDNSGRTPLSYAAKWGRVGAVKLFLEMEEINVESRDNRGRTPLSYAAQSESEKAVKLFLDRGEVDVESRDYGGRTPLSYAAEWGGVEVVKLLLEHEKVDSESQDNRGRTPLSYAASWGRVGTLKMFLERDKVNAESRDKSGRTPLLYAAKYGNEGAVKLLLEREEVDAESRDNGGRTPLSYAAGYWDEKVVKLFLEREDVNAESRDNYSRTPLTYALESGRVGAVKMLLAREEVDIESQDNAGRTPLFYALKNGSKEMLLLLREASPRSRALLDDEEVAAQLLRESVDTMAAIQPHDCRTPIPCFDSSVQGADSPVQRLLHSRGVIMNTPQQNAQHPSVTTLLVGDTDEDPESPAQHFRLNSLTSPLERPFQLDIAAMGSHESSPKLPLRRFSQAFEDKPSAHIMPKRRKAS